MISVEALSLTLSQRERGQSKEIPSPSGRGDNRKKFPLPLGEGTIERNSLSLWERVRERA
jgi:hypothetical protein